MSALLLLTDAVLRLLSWPLTRMAARSCYSGYKMHGQRISVRFLHQTLLNLFTVLSILVPMLLVMLERVVVPLEQQTAEGSSIGG